MDKQAKYLTVTEPIDFKIAQDRKNYNIEYAEEALKEAIKDLEIARQAPLVLEHKHQIKVFPDHPDYDKASDTPDLGYYLGEESFFFTKKVCEKLMDNPWDKLLDRGEYPENLGKIETVTTI